MFCCSGGCCFYFPKFFPLSEICKFIIIFVFSKIHIFFSFIFHPFIHFAPSLLSPSWVSFLFSLSLPLTFSIYFFFLAFSFIKWSMNLRVHPGHWATCALRDRTQNGGHRYRPFDWNSKILFDRYRRSSKPSPCVFNSVLFNLFGSATWMFIIMGYV